MIFPPAYITWLRAFWSVNPVRHTLKLLNEATGADFTERQLRDAARHYRLGPPAPPPPGARRQGRLFTEEQIQWLSENYDGRLRAETTRLFNQRFGASLTEKQIAIANKHYGFGVAVRPPLSEAARKTQFKSGPGGQPRLRDSAMFAERKTRDGILIKVPVPYQPPSFKRTGTGAHSRWIRKIVWIWTQANGPVPSGHVITTLDGDESNCDPENIVCVPRGTIAQMNRPSAPRNPVMRAERLRLAQLHQALHDRRASKHPHEEAKHETPPAKS